MRIELIVDLQHANIHAQHTRSGWKTKSKEHTANCNESQSQPPCFFIYNSVKTTSGSEFTVSTAIYSQIQITYSSTADLTSSLLIFPPTPDARSRAPAFDMVIGQNAPARFVSKVSPVSVEDSGVRRKNRGGRLPDGRGTSARDRVAAPEQ
jgi:hypothetical protein